MARYAYILLIPLLIIVLIVLIGLPDPIKTLPKQNELQQPTTNQIRIEQQEIIGIIRTSGLTDEEKSRFGLEDVLYQVTDFGRLHLSDMQSRIQGYFLSGTVPETYLGKCVTVTGDVPAEWINRDTAETYARLLLAVARISQTDASMCNPYGDDSPVRENTEEISVFRGTVSRASRPAPDIGYDYRLTLSEPFLDESSAAGGPAKISVVDIVPTSNTQWITLENTIGKPVTVEGPMVWGYAESRYLRILRIL